jgi:hypothetical protein
MLRNRRFSLASIGLAVALVGVLLVPCIAAAEAPPSGWTRYDVAMGGNVFQFDGAWTVTSLVPAWDGGYTVGAWNGSSLRTPSPGVPSGVSFKFVGTGFDWVARAGNIRGIAKLTLDGVVQPPVDLYSAVQTDQKIVFSASSLPNKLHTVVIEWTGTANPATLPGYNFVDIDAVDLPPGASLVPFVSTPASSPWSLALLAVAGLGVVAVSVRVRRRTASTRL